MSASLKLRCLTIVAATVIGASPLTAQRRPRALTTADIANQATPATATVIALGANGDTISQGSAFVIRADGIVLTNYHVLRGASSAIVTLASHERYARVRVVDADSALDLALLKIPAVDLASLTTRTSVPRAGEKVVAIGSPLGLSSTVSEGIISATRMVDGHELIQITAPISPGSSGGAVLDAEGRVFAVSTSYLQGGQSLNFAVPVKYAMGLLNDPAPEREIAAVFAKQGVANANRAPTAAALSAALLSFVIFAAAARTAAARAVAAFRAAVFAAASLAAASACLACSTARSFAASFSAASARASALARLRCCSSAR